MTITDGLERSMLVMMLSMEMIAAQGDPVGRNANWSEKHRVGGGRRKVRLRKSRTTVFSMILVRTGVMEMGWKSACCLGERDMGMGIMLACFHTHGTVDVAGERLKSKQWTDKRLERPVGGTRLEGHRDL
jgi:hypothetical protein